MLPIWSIFVWLSNSSNSTVNQTSICLSESQKANPQTPKSVRFGSRMLLAPHLEIMLIIGLNSNFTIEQLARAWQYANGMPGIRGTRSNKKYTTRLRRFTWITTYSYFKIYDLKYSLIFHLLFSSPNVDNKILTFQLCTIKCIYM